MSAEKLWKKPEGDSTVTFIRPSKLQADGITGVIVEGTYVESIPNQYDEGKLDYKFEKEDGSIVIVNGGGNLGFKMSKIMIGDYVQLSYEGMKEIKNGKMKGRKSHTFSILVAD